MPMKFRIFLSLSLWSIMQMAAAQNNPVQVVTKRIDKEFSYRDGYEVNIDGERAEVRIETWAKPTIKIQIDLIAKNSDKEQAEKDLEKMRYLAQRVKNKIYLRNYLDMPDGAPELQSQLKAVYVIMVPEDCPVYLKNNYGFADIKNLMSSLRLNTRFSRIGLENIKGNIDINTTFGDLFADKLDGNVKVASRRSDITFKQMRGSYDINAQYGILNFFATDGLLDFNLEADKSTVFFHNLNPQTLSYNLSVQNGRVEYPNELKFKLLDMKDTGIKKITFKPNKEYYPNVTISITFGDLYIGK
ncbi:MAG TPA: hypothetical protein PLC89_04140 [Haliscomenobacter sp.]|uniref:hypothetical protein n=1 Tax=Haliscomenobacter sp. TaxID=2717303 RepID=UPI002BDA9797|nr:hypothetical protein [Haliscomenobacter sp.]HOY16455.1 hypothetical protein [Haliscomenobacter sp.]HPH19729.1 hypothetical protein [Haliscomenobacter sp.]